jgi:hypothetical protein
LSWSTVDLDQALHISWLIKWKGYVGRTASNTWEPKENLLLESILKRAEEVKVKAVEHHGRTGRWI